MTTLRNELARKLPWVKPVPADHIPASEKRWVYVYLGFFLVGTILTLAAFSIVLLPLGLVFRDGIAEGFSGGFSGRALTFTDSAVASGLILFQLGLLFTIIWKKRQKRKKVAGRSGRGSRKIRRAAQAASRFRFPRARL